MNMIKKHFLLAAIAATVMLSCTNIKRQVIIKSPDGKTEVLVDTDNKGTPVYSVSYRDSVILESSSMGLRMACADFTKNLKIINPGKTEKVKDNYTLLNDKRSSCSYRANRRVITLSEINGVTFSIIFQVSDDGVAFRYLITGKPDSINQILSESTTFNFPSSARAWLTPHAPAHTGWEHTQPSYEEYYKMDMAVGTPSTMGQGWSFPALFKSGGAWILISETDIMRNYCGSHLAHLSPGGEYHIAFPQDTERTLPDAPLLPQSVLPWKSPWRVVILGSSPGIIVESTLCTDLSTPAKYSGNSFVNPGKASWSWVILKDTATVFPIQKQFIDYASEMKWNYCLIDAYWDRQIGYDKIAELAAYAKTKNVNLILWYNSRGNWNTSPLTPIYLTFDPQIRKEEFQKVSKMGIKGLKIDFFGGDGQSMLDYYQDLMEDAARCGLVVNFHGATIPRGWTRTYPNLVSMEAVRGFEFLTFEQANTNEEPTHCAILPFTRNAIGPMDFTPVCFSEIPHMKRITTNGFEIALSVLFQSGIQHYAEIPESMRKQPDYVVDFMRNLPLRWDDIKFLDGYPGKYVILARKGNGKWYVGGINGTEDNIRTGLDLSVLGQFDGGTIITGGNTDRDFSTRDFAGSSVKLDIRSHGGFVIRLN